MSNKLQEQVKLLAEKVGCEVLQVTRQAVAWDGLSYVNEEPGAEYAELPGADRTLTDDGTDVVLDWLHKADYKTPGDKAGIMGRLEIQEYKAYNFPFGSRGEFHTVASGEGNTKNEALAAAMLVLPLSDE